MFPLSQRPELRKQLRATRQALSTEFQNNASQKIVSQLKILPVFRASQRIALYLPYHGEVDIRAICALTPQNEYYLPILTDTQHLQFGFYHRDMPLKANKFGILEPITNQLLTADALDLVCVPLVGFDEAGNRLGMGGGYYDRTFAFKQNLMNQPFLLGIAYGCQKVDQLEAEVWDIPLNGILTEENFYSVQQ